MLAQVILADGGGGTREWEGAGSATRAWQSPAQDGELASDDQGLADWVESTRDAALPRKVTHRALVGDSSETRLTSTLLLIFLSISLLFSR